MLLINGNKVSMVICLNCFKRWIAARPIDVWLNELECPGCGQTGYAIETGETGIAEHLLQEASNDESEMGS